METLSMFLFLSLLLVTTPYALSEGSSFVKMPFLQLHGDIIQAIVVPNILHCCWKCDRLPECLSLNVADLPTKDGLYECQMLTTEANKYSGLLKRSQHYHHYTRFTNQCDISRCLNGGTCENLGLNHFRCHCPPGFMGELCNAPAKMYKWLKINTSPVCFGATGNSFGRFNVPENGSVNTVKLVHVSGYVVCDVKQQTGRSNWGCAPYLIYQDRLMTIITNHQNKKILPQDEFITKSIDFTYEMPGFSSKSSYLVFKEFTTPMEVTAGQEFRIWYGQDLKDYSDHNNGGKSCSHVYMYGLF